jgi:hypothetical protein
MSACVYCHQRKGKRPCPALGGLICPQCCGEHRVSRIACPPDCTYLASGGDYQQKRLGEQLAPLRQNFYREIAELGGEKAGALFNLVEVVAFGYFHARRDGQDAEIVAALQALRRSLSPLHVPTAPLAVFAEHLMKEYESYKKQQPKDIVELQNTPEVLDRAIKFVTDFSGDGFQSQRFLNALIGYVRTYYPEIAEHLSKHADRKSLILPGQMTPPREPEPPLHTHGPGCRHH